MEHYINKNILIDKLLEYDLTYDNNILYTFQELRNNTDFDNDIILLNNCIEYLDNMIYETNNYINNYVSNEYEYIIEKKFLNNLYEAKNHIINYLKSLNETDILSELLHEININ